MPRKPIPWEEMTPEQRKRSTAAKAALAKKQGQQAPPTPKATVPTSVEATPDIPAAPLIPGEKTEPPVPPNPLTRAQKASATDSPTIQGLIPQKVTQTKPEDVVVPEGRQGELIKIYFVADGWTALNKLWYEGEDVTVEVGSPEWRDTVDSHGFSWLDLTETQQIDRYEEVKFRHGPNPYKKLTKEQLEEAAKAGDVDPDSEVLGVRARKKQQRSADVGKALLGR